MGDTLTLEQKAKKFFLLALDKQRGQKLSAREAVRQAIAAKPDLYRAFLESEGVPTEEARVMSLRNSAVLPPFEKTIVDAVVDSGIKFNVAFRMATIRYPRGQADYFRRIADGQPDVLAYLQNR